jgi:hypothetical protein
VVNASKLVESLLARWRWQQGELSFRTDWIIFDGGVVITASKPGESLLAKWQWRQGESSQLLKKEVITVASSVNCRSCYTAVAKETFHKQCAIMLSLLELVHPGGSLSSRIYLRHNSEMPVSPGRWQWQWQQTVRQGGGSSACLSAVGPLAVGSAVEIEVSVWSWIQILWFLQCFLF